MRLRHALIVLSVLVLSLGLMGIGPVASGVGEHGWVVYQSKMYRVLIVHLPPRGPDGSAEPGTLESFRPLEITPEAITADGDRLWMVFPPSIINEETMRRVSSVRAVRAFGSSGWVVSPPELLKAGPMLPGTGSLKQFVSDSSGNLFAMLKRVDRWSLYSTGGGQWTVQPMPPISGSDWRLVRWGASVLLISNDPDGLTLAFELIENTWKPVKIPGIERVWDASFVLGHGRDLVLGASGSEGSMEIRVLTAGSDLLVHRIDAAPVEPGVVLLEDSNTLVLVSQPGEGGGARRSVRMVEIDLNDGRELFAGEPATPSFLGAGFLQLLMMLFFAVGSVIILAVVRPQPGGVFLVPEGWAIADPSRRFAATLIDLVILSTIIAPLFGVGIIELVTGNVLSRTDSSWIALPAMLFVGMLSSTVLESTIGGTIGKAVMRIRVTRCTQGPAETVAFSRVLSRNLIKWFLPPVAMLSLVEPGFRHRGDIAGRCIVVIRSPGPGSANGKDG